VNDEQVHHGGTEITEDTELKSRVKSREVVHPFRPSSVPLRVLRDSVVKVVS